MIKDKYYSEQFYNCIGDLIELEDLKKLDEFTQHIKVSRLEHSISVSYYSFKMSRFFKLDYKSAARAGLLHDLFFYDWKESEHSARQHTFFHPKTALENAKNITEINEIESNAIVAHMWPLSSTMLRHKESVVVSIADKYCTCAEVAEQLAEKTKTYLQKKYSLFRA